MAPFLSDEWVSAFSDPAGPVLAEQGEPLSILYVITGGPDGEVRSGTTVAADGSVSQTAGDLADPDVSLAVPHADALAVVREVHSFNPGFISGRTKVTGHTGRLLRVLAAGEDERAEPLWAALAAATD
jgi:hypothetical protein